MIMNAHVYTQPTNLVNTISNLYNVSVNHQCIHLVAVWPRKEPQENRRIKKSITRENFITSQNKLIFLKAYLSPLTDKNHSRKT